MKTTTVVYIYSHLLFFSELLFLFSTTGLNSYIWLKYLEQHNVLKKTEKNVIDTRLVVPTDHKNLDKRVLRSTQIFDQLNVPIFSFVISDFYDQFDIP